MAETGMDFQRTWFYERWYGQPWRDTTIQWNSIQYRDALKSKLENIQPYPSMNIPWYNILLISQVGSGKTSFCNTVKSTFAGDIETHGVIGTSDTSMTPKFEVHSISTNGNNELKFKLCDTQGLYRNFNYSNNEFERMINGTIPRGHEFGDNNRLPDEVNVANGDTTIQCVCFVFSLTTLDTCEQNTMAHFTRYKSILNQKGIHTVILLTHIDVNVSPKINRGRDVKHVYYSKEVEAFIKKASRMFGIPENQIFPIKNYINETEPVLEMEILTLYSLTRILNMCKGRMIHTTKMA